VSLEIDGRSGAMFNNNAHAILPSEHLRDLSYVQAVIRASNDVVSKTLG
jgi:hypothetical protein